MSEMATFDPNPDRAAKRRATHPDHAKSHSRNLVFTCAGGRSNVRRWTEGERDFDLWIVDYGEDPHAHAAVADIHHARPGKKFPNLAHAANTWPELWAQYDAIFVADDDVVLDATAISRLFAIRAEHQLQILQPAFLPSGIVSHAITAQEPGSFLRFTNFVEVTCPLFERGALDKFLRVYDAQIVGWGVDWWFLWVLGPDLRGKVAIVDAVSCANPQHERKPGVPERMPAHYGMEAQQARWLAFRHQHGIASEAQGYTTYGAIQSVGEAPVWWDPPETQPAPWRSTPKVPPAIRRFRRWALRVLGVR